MKKLYPTFSDVSKYRGKTQNANRLTGRESSTLRNEILERDGYKCSYCGFHAKEWQNIVFIDGDATNNKKSNLATACPMCTLVLNTHLGCQLQAIVELYEISRYNQKQIMQITRRMRVAGKTDADIKRFLGLSTKVPFKMNKEYLKGLFAFVTSWKGSWGEVEEALAYGYGSRS